MCVKQWNILMIFTRQLLQFADVYKELPCFLAAVVLGGSVGGFLVLCHKWRGVRCFPEAEEGGDIRAAALRSATRRPWTRNWSRWITASLSSSCQRSNRTGPPLNLKWLWEIPALKEPPYAQIISHLLSYYKNTERNKCTLSWSFPPLPLVHPCLCVPLVGSVLWSSKGEAGGCFRSEYGPQTLSSLALLFFPAILNYK